MADTWKFITCDDGYVAIVTDGDVICVPDHNHEPGDAADESNFRLIAIARELLGLAYQYRDDLLHPPAPASRERRLQAIEFAIAKAECRS